MSRDETQTPTPAPEGRRARKRRETRERIVARAMALFLERGYDATTMNDIAEAADVSRRSLFDYFPTKEDVALADQEAFIPAVVEQMRRRPPDEPWPLVIEHAMTHAVEAASTPEAYALDALVRQTPALQPRRQLKYLRLEQAIAAALAERARGPDVQERAALLAAVVVAAFRLAATTPGDVRFSEGIRHSVARDFRGLWQSLREFGEAGLAAHAPRTVRTHRVTARKKSKR